MQQQEEEQQRTQASTVSTTATLKRSIITEKKERERFRQGYRREKGREFIKEASTTMIRPNQKSNQIESNQFSVG